MSRLSHTTRPIWVTAAAACLLALHWWLGVTGWFGKSVTSDETAHLVSGYSYWKFDDYRLQPENGNLPQRWGALPLLLQKPRLEPSDEPIIWHMSDVWGVGQRFFFESGNNSDFMLATARAAMALWSVALGLLVFVCSRHLWGDAGGLFSLTLYALSPTLLANGPLVTSDVTATFFLVAAPLAFWNYLRAPSRGRLAVSLASLGLAAVAKFSFLVLGPVYFVLLGVHAWQTIRGGHVTPRRWAGKTSALVAMHVGVAWIVIWACFGWRYSGFAPELPKGFKYYYPWQELLINQPGWRGVLSQAKAWHLLPEAYIHGFAYVLHAAQARGAFLAGHYSQTGWWWFFPYSFLVKTPLAELLAYGSAAVGWVWWRLKPKDGGTPATTTRADAAGVMLPLAALFAVYWAISIVSNLNIGHRHLLPIYPALMIFAGWLLRVGASRRTRAGALGLALLALVESTSVRPHYLAFFNATAGGPASGWKHLVDSSLDWGQDLPGLAAWLRTNRQPTEKVYLSYFGSGSPAYEGISFTPLAPYYFHYKPRSWEELGPGLYCVSATMLQDPYSSWNGEWQARHETAYQFYLRTMRAELKSGKRSGSIAEFGNGDNKPLWDLDRLRFARLCLYLRLRRPDAVVNHTFFIYRLSSAEVETIVDGSTEQLAVLMDRALFHANSH